MSDKKFHFNMFDYANRAQPEFVEIADAHRPYVKMGEDNMYPHYLEALYTGSAIHSAVVKGVADMIYGHGLGSPEEDKHVDQYLNLQALFSDKTCLRRLCFDYKLYGQGYLNVIYSADRSKIAEVHHLPSANLRAGQVNDDGEVEVYYYSDNWAEVTQGRKEPQPIPAFDTQDRTAASQVLHIKQYSPISHYYGVCDYIGSQRYIDLDREISEFHLANIRNGLMPSLILNFNNGVPSSEERSDLERLIYDKFGGATNAGKFLMTFNDSSENAPTIESFQPTDPQQVYAFMSSEVVTKILSGHRVTSPLLFGIRDEGGGFGSNADEMRDGYDLFYHTVIQPMQEHIVQNLRPLLSVNNIVLPIEFKKLVPAAFMDKKEEPRMAPAVQMSSEKKISKGQGQVWLNRLKFKASPMPEGWIEVKRETVDDHKVDRRIHERQYFYNEYANFEEPSEWGDVTGPDGTQFALRYEYKQTDDTPRQFGSREFCEDMMRLADQGAKYRYEDIQDMGDDGVNEDFAAAGEDRYSIWEFKGGVYCRHGWVRVIYASQADQTLSREELAAEWDEVMKRVGANPYVPGVGIEREAPNQMPNRASLK
jgi:hypothetical protein